MKIDYVKYPALKEADKSCKIYHISKFMDKKIMEISGAQGLYKGIQSYFKDFYIIGDATLFLCKHGGITIPEFGESETFEPGGTLFSMWLHPYKTSLINISIDKSFNNFQYLNPEFVKEMNDIDYYQNYVFSSLGRALKYKSFLEFADPETYVLGPRKKMKRGQLKHINKTSSDVILIDKRWNGNIISSNPFSVSGHWRNQPYKDGIKLKWINPFMKKGYRSKARMLNQ